MQSSHLFPFPLLLWRWGRGNWGDDGVQKWYLQVINRVGHAGWRRAGARSEAGGCLKRAEGWRRGRGGRGGGGVIAVLSAEPASSLSAQVDEEMCQSWHRPSPLLCSVHQRSQLPNLWLGVFWLLLWLRLLLGRELSVDLILFTCRLDWPMLSCSKLCLENLMADFTWRQRGQRCCTINSLEWCWFEWE